MSASDAATRDEFALHRCTQCSFVRTVPIPADLDRYYPATYRGYSRPVLALFRWVQELRVSWWRARGLPRTGRCLEVGCGHGWMLAALKRRGWEVLGVERSERAARFATEQLGIDVHIGELTEIEGPFDLIVMHEVLEHLPAPMDALTECKRLLGEQGRLIVEVPNFASWQARISGRHWFHLDVPRHLGHFTPETLREALSRNGLEVERTSFVTLEYDPYGWLQSILNRMGFPQNLLLRWLAGEWKHSLFTPLGLLMALLCLLLAGPAWILSVASWVARAGAVMEVTAVRA